MKKINISTKNKPGVYAIVDDEDYERINENKWFTAPSGDKLYAIRHVRRSGGLISVNMAKLVMRYVGDKVVDHINGDSLDNRKCNLRLCTQLQNMKNLSLYKRNTTGHKGVSYRKESGRYRARITNDNKTYTIGHYKTAKEAAIAYNEVAKVMHGEYANLNKEGGKILEY